jgi:hypothetical protein
VNKDAQLQLSLTASSPLYPGQNMFANPYTSAINIKKMGNGSATGLNKIVYLYNTGSYDDWRATTPGTISQGNSTAGQYNSIPMYLAGDVEGLPSQIPSMQGFMLFAKVDGAVLTFPYSCVESNSIPQRVSSKTNSLSVVSTCIDVKGLNRSDRMWIVTIPGCTRGYDDGWDGRKMMGSALNPQLYAIEADGNYQVNSVAEMNNIDLGFQRGQDLEDTLIFTHQNTEQRYAGIYLVDLVENKTVDVTASGSTYAFIADTTLSSVKRFKIVTRSYEKDAPDAETHIKVFSSGNRIFVQNTGNLSGEIVVCDMMGRMIKNCVFGPYGVTTVQAGFMPGAYVVNAATREEKVGKRIILSN